MNRLRKVLGLLVAAVMLAAFALPSMADSTTKSFSVTFPAAVQNGTQSILVTFTNTTPGVSTINAVQITPPAGVTFPSPPTATPGSAVSGPNGSLIITGFPGIKTQKSLTFTLTVIVNVQICAQVSWPIPGANAGSSGDPFIFNATGSQLTTAFGPCDNKVACGASFPDGNTVVTRGAYNKDGSPCPPAWYNSTVDLANKKVSLQVDPNQPAAVFSVDITWNPDFVNTETGLPNVTMVAWDQNPLPVPGRFCISPDLPAPYGTVAAPGITSASQTQFSTTLPVVFAATPSVTAPIPVIVDKERMNVTGQSGALLTVQRGQGGTTAISHDLYYLNTTTLKSLMSTPFPLDGNGVVMQVCIAIENNETVSADQCANLPNPLNPPVSCVQSLTTVYGDYSIIK